MDEREKLTKVLLNVCLKRKLHEGQLEALADFVIEDRKRIVGPLIKMKKKWSLPRLLSPRYSEAIDQTLSNAGIKE